MSAQCQELNHLFSHCVDGGQIKVPHHLGNPPKPSSSAPEFILDILHNAAKELTSSAGTQFAYFDCLPSDGLDLLLSKDSVAFSDFEMLKMTALWCLRHRASLQDYLHFFDFDQMSDEQRAWTVAQLPPSEELPSLVMNSMTRSNILTLEELHHFKLDVPGMRWKCVFDSSSDRMGRFMDAASTALELFHRKIIVVHVSTRLSIAMYIPVKLEKYKEGVVNDAVRVLSFPHSQGNETAYRRALPTKKKYRFYFDDNGFQLFEQNRSNTWIFLRKPGSDDASYTNIDDRGDKRRARNATVQACLNSDFITSIALNKFSAGLTKHIGRVTRMPVFEAEMFVISNRDVRSLQVLDQWLEFVDTADVMPLFDNPKREYEVPSIKYLDWAQVPGPIRLIARDTQFSSFQNLSGDQDVVEIFEWLWIHRQKTTLRKAFHFLLDLLIRGESRLPTSTLASMIRFLQKAPFLVTAFAGLGQWNLLPDPINITLKDRAVDLLKALALAANEVESLIVEPFRHILSQISCMSWVGFAELVELIALVVRSIDTALDLLVGCLEPESSRLLVARPRVAHYFIKNYICIVIDHIGERVESSSKSNDFLDLQQDPMNGLVKAQVRIDSPASVMLSTNDHIQLTATTAPVNSLETKIYSMDALVEKADPGTITIRSLHALPSFIEDCSWRLEKCGSYVTTKTMFEALNNCLLGPEQNCIIFERMIAVVPFPKKDLTPCPPLLNRRELNESQKSAVAAAIGNPLTCLWGPPGTGKTHTIAVILDILSSDPAQKILVTAPTHNAVDNIMRKFLLNMSRVETSDAFVLRVSTDVGIFLC